MFTREARVVTGAPRYRCGRIATQAEISAARELLLASFSSTCRSEVDDLLNEGCVDRTRSRADRKRFRPLDKALNLALYEETTRTLWPSSYQDQARVKVVACLLAAPRCGEVLHVVYAATDPVYRQRGCMQQLFCHLQQLGVPIVVHATQEAKLFWKRRGMTQQITGRQLRPKYELAQMTDTDLLVSPHDYDKVVGPERWNGSDADDDTSESEEEASGLLVTKKRILGDRVDLPLLYTNPQAPSFAVCVSKLKRRRTSSSGSPETEPHRTGKAGTPSSASSVEGGAPSAEKSLAPQQGSWWSGRSWSSFSGCRPPVLTPLKPASGLPSSVSFDTPPEDSQIV